MWYQKSLDKSNNDHLQRQYSNALRIVIVFACLLLLTRALTLTHNMRLHPDEHVFVKSSISLLNSLIRSTVSYETVKPYPEGTFVFHLPFHALQYILFRITGISQDPYIWGRIAGVFYFFMGWLLGSNILYSYFTKSRISLSVYGLAMCFSLLQIEQSRYGTGDPVSFFVINTILLCCAVYIRKGKRLWFFLTCFSAGTLAAVKYPLLLFSLVPVLSLFIKEQRKDRILHLFLGIVFVIAGFLLFSPSVIRDWHYLQRVFFAETAQYLKGGSISEVGGFWNHLLSVILYHLLYSDIPLGPLFFLLGVATLHHKRAKTCDASENTGVLFCWILPAVTVLFFFYNLFVPLLYFRTYYPFFCISILYGSFALGTWLGQRGFRQFFAVVVLSTLVFRGSSLVFALIEVRPNDRLIASAEAITGGQESRIIFLEPIQLFGLYDPGKAKKPENYETITIDAFRNETDGSLEIAPGDLIITANFEFGRAQQYLLPVQNNTVNLMIDTWAEFKKINSPYLRETAYPRVYYYLFGYWLKGSSAGSLEFPDNYIYYRQRE